MNPPATIGIVTNLTKPEALERTRELAVRFRACGRQVVLESGGAAALGEAPGVALTELGSEADVVVVLGGDGTILYTARRMGRLVRPLAAINTGRLGFLTTSTAGEIDSFVESLCTGNFQLSQRSLIQAEFTDRKGRQHSLCGLNEVTVSRGAISRLLRLEVSIDGAQLNRYSGDGLIVATPTGSTAYSLSAGGPLVNPEADVFLVTPICPHALASRVFVVNDDATIQIRPEEHREEILLTVDGGEPFSLRKDTTVNLRRADYTLPLVMLRHRSFYAVLQQKLRWMETNT
ncbi:MAG: NAD(+)/NADH kinase [Verrucomicrobiales bacterium]|nr:NAD(+)/NADH kinase [Verrucomicrobiales bacterium]